MSRKESKKENWHRIIFENANDGIILHEPEGKILDVNKKMYQRLGYTKDEMIKMSLKELVSHEYESKINNRINKLESEGVAIFESGDIRKDGTVLPVEVSAQYVNYKERKVILSIVRDISDRKMAEELIQETLKAKEILLNELLKRIAMCRNTFYRTLKQLDDSHIDKEDKTIESAKNRIKWFGQIQDRVYKTPNLLRIDLSELIRILLARLTALYPKKAKDLNVRFNMPSLFLDLHQTISCVVIMGELLSNVFQHAFSGKVKGKVFIRGQMDENNRCILEIEDNGIGLPASIDVHKSSTLGLQLVSEHVDVLEGTLEIEKNKGSKFTLSFKTSIKK